MHRVVLSAWGKSGKGQMLSSDDRYAQRRMSEFRVCMSAAARPRGGARRHDVTAPCA